MFTISITKYINEFDIHYKIWHPIYNLLICGAI